MLTKVEVYTSMPGAAVLMLDEDGSPETDPIQVRHVDGLEPIKSSIVTSPYGRIDGAAIVGAEVLSRNIVFTLGPNPDWITWTFETLRQFIYSYFMPKSTVKLVFYSDEVGIVETSGTVEDIIANKFTKDPEFIVSIVCPDPYFKSTSVLAVTGETVVEADYDTAKIVVPNGGNVPTGIEVSFELTAETEYIYIQIGPPEFSTFHILANPTSPDVFEMSSVPLHKYARVIDSVDGSVQNILNGLQSDAVWPYLQPGDNDFAVLSDIVGMEWTLMYYERYGGL